MWAPALRSTSPRSRRRQMYLLSVFRIDIDPCRHNNKCVSCLKLLFQQPSTRPSIRLSKLQHSPFLPPLTKIDKGNPLRALDIRLTGYCGVRRQNRLALGARSKIREYTVAAGAGSVELPVLPRDGISISVIRPVAAFGPRIRISTTPRLDGRARRGFLDGDQQPQLRVTRAPLQPSWQLGELVGRFGKWADRGAGAFTGRPTITVER